MTVTREEAEEVFEELKKWYGFPDSFGAKLKDDSNEWAFSDEGAWFIFWEGGPYDWTMTFWADCKDKFPNLILQSVCGWGLLGIYRA